MVNAYKATMVRRSLAVFSVALFVGCSGSPEWTVEELEQGQHLSRALELTQSATRVSNSKGPGSLSEADYEEILRYQREALNEGSQVSDEFLSRVHPDLPRHFRDEWERGLTLRVRNLDVGDLNAEVTGSALLDAFGDWYTGTEFGIPR